MGLLDDAIREHLELKRRHGAPAEEIQRQEHEALGPIRRRGEPEPDVLAEPEPGVLAESDPAADPDVADDPDLAAVPTAPTPVEPLDDPVFETPADPEIAVPEEATAIIPPPPVLPASEQPVMPEPAGHEPVIEDFPAADGPADSDAGRAASFVDDDPWLDDSAEAPPADVLEPPGQSTTAFSAAEAAGDREPVEDDVLEETPDFLQETPEHDRLWFEQRPPRGFDFEQ